MREGKDIWQIFLYFVNDVNTINISLLPLYFIRKERDF